MTDVIDFSKYQAASAEACAAKLLADACEDIANGPMAGLQGVLLAWINSGGLVEFRYSENISVDSVLAMTGPVQLACSWSLWHDVSEGDDG